MLAATKPARLRRSAWTSKQTAPNIILTWVLKEATPHAGLTWCAPSAVLWKQRDIAMGVGSTEIALNESMAIPLKAHKF